MPYYRRGGPVGADAAARSHRIHGTLSGAWQLWRRRRGVGGTGDRKWDNGLKWGWCHTWSTQGGGWGLRPGIVHGWSFRSKPQQASTLCRSPPAGRCWLPHQRLVTRLASGDWTLDYDTWAIFIGHQADRGVHPDRQLLEVSFHPSKQISKDICLTL
jgi:hypothetical protein